MKHFIFIISISFLLFSCKKDCLEKGDCELSDYQSTYLVEQTLPAATGTVYYIDAVDGKKNASGTSESEAFKEIEQLENITFEPGDQILFKRGQVHYGVFELTEGGTAQDRIYIADYGTGHLPVIKSEDGDNDKSNKFTMTLKEAPYVTIQNLNIQGGSLALVLSNSDYCIIAGCRIGEKSNSGFRATATYSNGDGSDFGEMKNCLIYSGLSGDLGDRQGTDGIQLSDGASNWHIHDCEIKAWTHSAVWIKQLYNSEDNNYNLIENNLIDCNDIDYMRALDITGGENLVAHNVFTKNIIRNQTVTSHLHGNNNDVSYNLFLDLQSSSATEQPWAIDFHVFSHHSGTVNSSETVCHDNRVFNNLIINYGNGSGIRFLKSQSSTTNLVKDNLIVNNIFYNVGTAIEMDAEPEGTIISNNLFFNPSGSANFRHDNSSYNLSAFQGITTNGLSSFSNFESDPLFVNVSAENFYLSAGSDCIDNGIDMGVITDFYGNPINGTPDIGPVEF